MDAIIEAELNIPPELKDIVKDKDNDFYLRFTDTEELNAIFTTLEENNLLEIQRMQESEEELALKKQLQAKTMADYDKQISVLLANEASNNARIQRT